MLFGRYIYYAHKKIPAWKLDGTKTTLAFIIAYLFLSKSIPFIEQFFERLSGYAPPTSNKHISKKSLLAEDSF